jgi:hypothetical protein
VHKWAEQANQRVCQLFSRHFLFHLITVSQCRWAWHVNSNYSPHRLKFSVRFRRPIRRQSCHRSGCITKRIV